MDNLKDFKPNSWQIKFLQDVMNSEGKMVVLVPRRAGLTTILKYLEKHQPKLYEKFIRDWKVI